MFLKEYLSTIPKYKCPSSDRISQVFRKISTPITKYKHKEIEHSFCINTSLNRLMLNIIKALNLIDTNILDYDNVIIETNKYDATWTYKKNKGYQPGVCFMNKVPVYIEGRDGKSSASYKMKETLIRSLNLLKEKSIPIKYFRSDAAAYQKKVIDLMNKNNIEFFIRVKKRPTLLDEIQYNINNWEPFTIKNQNMDVGESTFIPFVDRENKIKKQKEYRIVVSRIKSNNEYVYRTIMTTNTTMSKKEVLKFYNQRGSIERNFDDLKNNFNWNRLPFSFLNENTTFLIISAIANIIYHYLIKTFNQKVDFVKHNFRLKNFIFNFITVGSEWEDEKLKLFTSRNYKMLV